MSIKQAREIAHKVYVGGGTVVENFAQALLDADREARRVVLEWIGGELANCVPIAGLTAEIERRLAALEKS